MCVCVRGVRVECPLDSLHFIVYTSLLLCIFNYDRRRQRINGLMGVVVPVLRGGVVYMVVFFFFWTFGGETPNQRNVWMDAACILCDAGTGLPSCIFFVFF